MEFPHWWGDSAPIPKTVWNFPTGGEIPYRFSNRCRISPPTESHDINGGEIKDRFWGRYSMSPPVGKLSTDSKNGTQFPQW